VVAEAVRGIASAAVDAGWPESVEACATAYAEELTALDEEIAAAVSAIEPDSRLLVTNHDAFGYFADRYGFTVLGTILPATSTLAEANPADLAELAEKVQETGVTAIFYDLQASSADAQAFADRLDGIQAVSLLSGALVEDPEIGADYLTMMRTNADRIVAGLSN
jgi:zinc/manganese transport system substrate-binding protein